MRPLPLLGGLSPPEFLRDYWQKRPLLVRGALPGFRGIVDRDALIALAGREDAIARLVIERPRRRARWERHDGPFLGLDARLLPETHWTLLVHGVESLKRGGWELLREFSFLPAARIDDLMVSYAARGGSVGPHDDLYDVFLLQGPGRRRWQVSAGGDRALDPGAAIKVLARFVPDEEWVLEPGDMLYLPPGVAHYGVAEEPCFTYSIGFLAPSRRSIVESFLGYLGGALGASPDAETLVRIADARAPADPFELGGSTVRAIAAALDGVRWDGALVEDFVGCFSTRPKPHVAFAPPSRPRSPAELERRLRGRGRLELALASRGLHRRGRVFLNGEAHRASPSTRRWFARLVHDRALSLPLALDARALALVHAWYAAGYLAIQPGGAVRGSMRAWSSRPSSRTR